MASQSVTIERFDPKDAVLVLVDVQNDFCHPDGSASRAGFDVGLIDPAVDRLLHVLGAARAAGIPVVFVRTAHDDVVDSQAWTHRTQGGIGPGYHPATANCRTGTWGAEFYRVALETDDPVVTKHRYSGFVGTDLDMILRSLGRPSLVFAGYTTNVCVETTLRDGLSRDYLVSVVGDACAAFDPEEHEASLAVVARYFGAVTSSHALIERWQPDGARVDTVAAPVAN
jgi:ureidoacrylate peracid hydrolase